jgi:RNA-binding protein Luc7-like 2
MAKEKQMKVCEVCGAMQSLQDNEKRLQTHIEGKLHTGYLRIREHLDILRRRKLDRKFRLEEVKERERMQKELKDRERIRDKNIRK